MGRRLRQTAAPTIRGRATDVIEKQRTRLRRSLGTAVDGRDPEGVHDMRVASRRLRAALAVFAPWLPPKKCKRAARSVRRLTRALGTVRELDVLRLRLGQLAAPGDGARRIAIEIIDSRAARDLIRARRRMMKSFAKIDLDALDVELRELVGAPPAWAVEGEEASTLSASGAGTVLERDAGVAWTIPADGPTTDEPIGVLLDTLRAPVVRAARSLVGTPVPGEIGSPEAAEKLHEIRVRAKKLRYQLEIVAPYGGAEAAHLLRTLKGVQEHLGDFHDDCVLDDVLAATLSQQAALARPLLVRELRNLRDARRSALLADETACRHTLEDLRRAGFARAVANLFAPAPRSAETPEDGADAPATPGSPGAPMRRPAAPPTVERYAGEPMEKKDAPTPRSGAGATEERRSVLPLRREDGPTR